MKTPIDADHQIKKDEDSLKSSSSSKTNLPPGWTRTTVAIREDHLQKLQALAWWERALYREVLEEILEKFFSSREIPPIPEKRKILSDD